ncbi:dihydrodipicolinate synthase family protein [Variovorax terrae]|uniref:Dihydrodipicolinate synthase family protein n=1 Tax=Variovorax terrae TaxID=2923278 RepID=A0A9X1VV63_9BURK|nr:dihydrodipicolinate synthase family protein [Variovorax terrae]MCJ0763855.1 dihydrodipicolinate synthase family protein [Variovorax terrae]
MTPQPIARFRGIYAATICPLNEDDSIDEATLAQHLRAVAGADGMTGLLLNGHAGENFMLAREDKRRVLEIARAECPPGTLLVCGIHAEDSREARRHVEDAEAAGADAVLIFPPFSWAVSQDSEVAVRHHRMATETSGLPLFLYQAGVGAGRLAYTPEVLARLVRLPNVVGVKEGSWETAAYEAHQRLVRQAAPHVLMMASGDEHLFTCFALGTEGSQVSLACVAPELIVGLYRAMQAGDLAAARGFNDRIYPLAKAVYGTAPGGHATARLKTCLMLLGRIPSDRMRAPMGPLPATETEMLRQALRAAGLAPA